MKTLYSPLIALLLFSISSRAQLILTKAVNEPIVGDIRNAVSYDTVTALPKNTGANQSWNFSNMSANNFTETTTFISTGSATGASLFLGATIASSRGGNSFEFFKATANTWEFVGDYQTMNAEYFSLSNTGIFYNWPISFNSTFSDVAAGVQSSGSGTNVLNATISYTASGSGTVTLPGAVVYNNCLQITQKITATVGTGTNSTLIDQTAYLYFASGKKFPIAEIQYSTQTDMSGSSNDFWAMLEFNPPVGLQDNLNLPLTFQLYPNPAQNKVYIEIPGDIKEFSLKVVDTKGAVIFIDENTAEIDVSQWSPGLYTFCLSSAQTEQRMRIAIVD